MNTKDVLEFINHANPGDVALIQREASNVLIARLALHEWMQLTSEEKAMVIRGDTHLAVKSVRDRLCVSFNEAYDLVHTYRMSV